MIIIGDDNRIIVHVMAFTTDYKIIVD